MPPPNHRPDDGPPQYPWGSSPWPGTDYSDPPKDDKHAQEHANRDSYFEATEVKSIHDRLQVRRNELDELKKHLEEAGKLEPKHFASPLSSGKTMYNTAYGANSILLGAFDYFLRSYDALLKRLEVTHDTKTSTEHKNISQLISLGQSVDPSKPDLNKAKPLSAQPDPSKPPGQGGQTDTPPPPGAYK